jgi:glycosyltransferase involved in cell wall biosynthesis
MKLNTAIICLSPNAGGMELDAIKLAKNLSSYTKIILIAKENHFIANQKNNYKDIKLETIKFSSNLGFSIIKNARKIIVDNQIKNVIFFGASELKSLYFSFLGLNINLIVRHGTTKSRPKKDWFHRLIYSKVNYHIAISKHLQKNIRYIIPFGKRTQEKLIYPSFNFKNPKHIKENRLTLLHIGRIAQGKGQIDAIKACEILIQNNIDFIFNIVGGFEPLYEKEFMVFYENCLYKEKINLIGFTDNMKNYIYKADIFLFPSYGEGFGNSFIEASSNNLISLVYKNTTFLEFKDLGFYFVITKNKNIKDLKNKLLETVKNLTIEKKNSNKNYEIAKKIFTLEKEINSYLTLLV